MSDTRKRVAPGDRPTELTADAIWEFFANIHPRDRGRMIWVAPLSVLKEIADIAGLPLPLFSPITIVGRPLRIDNEAEGLTWRRGDETTQ